MHHNKQALIGNASPRIGTVTQATAASGFMECTVSSSLVMVAPYSESLGGSWGGEGHRA
jgi:hypothetical protein